MNKPAALLLLLTLLCAPSIASALQERTITDEPSISKPSAPPAASKTAPAPAPAPAAPATEPTPAPASQPPAYQPPAQGSGSGSGGAWTPGGSQPAQEPSAPAAPGTRVTEMPEARKVETYSRKEIDEQVMGFFEGGARGLADVISRAFERYGEPTGFIKGGEGAGALVVGLRYGEGWLYLKNGKKAYVYWQSPSIGFDLGANASKVFCLVYGMNDPVQIYQRFPSVDGSAYVVGGFGMNFQRAGDVTLAPIRFGVGLRLGVNAGYMGFTRERTINPF